MSLSPKLIKTRTQSTVCDLRAWAELIEENWEKEQGAGKQMNFNTVLDLQEVNFYLKGKIQNAPFLIWPSSDKSWSQRSLCSL